MARPVHVVLGAMALSVGLIAQAVPVPAAAARLGLRLLRSVPFDGRALPAIEILVNGRMHTLRRLCVQADGERLLVDVLGQGRGKLEVLPHRVFAVSVADGTVVEITPEPEAQLVGSLGAGPLLFDGTKVFAPHRPGIKPFAAPERSDAVASPSGTQVLVTSLERSVVTRLWHPDTGTIRGLGVQHHHASAVAFAPDGRVAVARSLFVAGGEQETSEGIRIVDAEAKVLRDLPAAAVAVTAMDFSVAGDELYYVAGGVHRVAAADGKVLAKSDQAPLYWFLLDADTALGIDGTALRLHDARTLERVKEYTVDEAPPDGLGPRLAARGAVVAVALSADRRLVAVATYRELRLYSVVGR